MKTKTGKRRRGGEWYNPFSWGSEEQAPVNQVKKNGNLPKFNQPLATQPLATENGNQKFGGGLKRTKRRTSKRGTRKH